MSEPTTPWLVEHAGKLYAAAAAIAGATAAGVTMKARVRILGDRFDEYIARDARMHDDINTRLDRQEHLVAEQGTAIRLLQQDIRHLSSKLDHYLDEQAALERAERYAAIHVEALRRAGVLIGRRQARAGNVVRLKSTAVSVDGIHPALVPHLFRIDDWCRNHLGYELVITSCTDGIHSATSRHYLGTAIDLRTWTTPESGVQISEPRRAGLVAGLKAFLGRDWFVLDEGTHIHIDWRPLRPE